MPKILIRQEVEVHVRNFNFPVDLYKRLKMIAQKENRTITGQLIDIVENYIDLYENNHLINSNQ